MPKAFDGVHPLIFLLIATTLEVSGDAVVRMGLYHHVGLVRRWLPDHRGRHDRHVLEACLTSDKE